jgi:hypothetical protein
MFLFKQQPAQQTVGSTGGIIMKPILNFFKKNLNTERQALLLKYLRNGNGNLSELLKLSLSRHRSEFTNISLKKFISLLTWIEGGGGTYTTDAHYDILIFIQYISFYDIFCHLVSFYV